MQQSLQFPAINFTFSNRNSPDPNLTEGLHPSPLELLQFIPVLRGICATLY